VPSAWQTPSAHDVGLLVAVGVIATIGHYGIVAAHRWARPAQLAPLGYIEIAGAVIAGAFLFQALPVAATWAGIVLIVASGIAAARSTEA
jgi:drug/metabolite transporter (DMT)-like permease